MSKRTKALDAIFHPAVFVTMFLVYGASVIINFVYRGLLHPWNMWFVIPLAIFCFLSYMIDEHRNNNK